MQKEYIQTLKDKYALNTLTNEEKADLEIALINNPDLDKELAVNLDLVKGVQYAGDLELRELLDRIHYQNAAPQEERKSLMFKLFILISGILVILTMIKLSHHVLSKSSSEEILYAQFFEPYTPSLNTRGSNLEANLQAFNALYHKKSYSEALTLITPYLDSNSNGIRLLASICAIESNELQQAHEILDKIISSKDYYFIDHAKWYKGLALIKENNSLSAKALFQELANDSKADHYKEATAILQSLK